MQVRDTRITPEGRMLTVEFVGQGGELVSIAMDNSDNNIDAQNAVEHAKAIMVQLVSSGGEGADPGVNRNNALSDGNFDEGGLGLQTPLSVHHGQDHETLKGAVDEGFHETVPTSEPVSATVKSASGGPKT